MAERKGKAQTEHDQLMAAIQAANDALFEIKKELAERKHLDTMVKDHEDLMNGNGKPGLKSIRDMVLGWQTKINAITLLLVSDIVLQIVRFAFPN